MSLVTYLSLGILGIAGVLCLVRLVTGPSLANRIIALDTALYVIVAGIAVYASHTGEMLFLDVMVVAALLGFVGTVTIARAIEWRRSR